MSHAAISTRFDEWADDGRGEAMEQGHGDVVRQVLARLALRPGQRVLDLGCGTGWATRLLAEAAPGVQAIGVDVSPRMVARSEELTSLRIRARYECCAFEALGFRDASFDLAFSMEALYYALDLSGALRELARVLKPGAEAHVVIDYYEGRPGTESWPERMQLALQSLSEEAWGAAFTSAGFTSVETEHVVDTRPSVDEDFQAGSCFGDAESHRRFLAAGSLWIRARR